MSNEYQHFPALILVLIKNILNNKKEIEKKRTNFQMSQF